jgi:hypothetical protein
MARFLWFKGLFGEKLDPRPSNRAGRRATICSPHDLIRDMKVKGRPLTIFGALQYLKQHFITHLIGPALETPCRVFY